MVHTEHLDMVSAEQHVQQGSDIVVIPYSSFMDADESVRLTVYTRMAAHAAAELYDRAATPETSIVAVGEHTYGLDTTSTTELIYDYLAANGVPQAAFAAEHPRRADATPQQIDWLQRTFGKQWQVHAPVLIGHEPHWRRIQFLCRLYKLPAGFIDAAEFLSAAGKLSPADAEAARLYKEQNQRYEDRVHRLTRSVAWLGPTATTRIFKTFTSVRTPNVVDVVHTPHGASFYASPVRRHKRTLQRSET